MVRTIPDDLAFPILDRQNLRGGLTKREEFAKAAMQGLLAGAWRDNLDIQGKTDVTNMAVKMADILIDALNKEN